MRLSAVILAGGRSRRMGREKALLPMRAHASLLERQIELVRSLRPIEVLVSCRPQQRLLLPLGLRRVHDDGQAGPLGGVAAALRAMSGEALLVVGVDLAGMPEATLRRIVSAADRDGSIGVIPRSSRGAEVLASVLPRSVLSLAAGQLAAGTDFSLQTLARSTVGSGLARWFEIAVFEEPAFANWNRPSDRLRGIGVKP